MENYTVLVPPYTVGPEAYRSIPEYCRVYGTTAVVIGGKKAMAAAHDKLLAAVDGSEIAISGFFHFGTECTFSAAHALEAAPAIKNADLILVMNEGDVIEKGTHDELMEKGGFYSTLYNSQFAVV